MTDRCQAAIQDLGRNMGGTVLSFPSARIRKRCVMPCSCRRYPFPRYALPRDNLSLGQELPGSEGTASNTSRVENDCFVSASAPNVFSWKNPLFSVMNRATPSAIELHIASILGKSKQSICGISCIEAEKRRPLISRLKPGFSSQNPLALGGDATCWIPIPYTLFYRTIQEEKGGFARIFQKPAYIPRNP